MNARRVAASLLSGIAISLFGQPAAAQLVTTAVNFDDFDTSGGNGIGAPVATYLNGYGISFGSTVSTVVPIIQFAPPDPANVAAISAPNLFGTGGGSNSGYGYTFTFSTPLTSFGFQTPAIGSTSTMAAWSATARAADNTVLSNVGNSFISGPGTLVQSYLLTGPGIHHIDWFSNVQNFAGHQLKIDNVSMTVAIPEPQTYALLLAGLGLLGFAARRRKGSPS